METTSEYCLDVSADQLLFLYLFVSFNLQEEKKDDLETYVTVSVDTEHKVKDHYHVHEQLGV